MARDLIDEMAILQPETDEDQPLATEEAEAEAPADTEETAEDEMTSEDDLGFLSAETEVQGDLSDMNQLGSAAAPAISQLSVGDAVRSVLRWDPPQVTVAATFQPVAGCGCVGCSSGPVDPGTGAVEVKSDTGAWDPVSFGNPAPGNFFIAGITGIDKWSEGPPAVLAYNFSDGSLSDFNYFLANSATLTGYGASQANHANLLSGGGNAGDIRADIRMADVLISSVSGLQLNEVNTFQTGTNEFRFMAFNNLSGLNGVATFPGTDPSSDDYESFILYNNNNGSMTVDPELGAASNRIHVVIHEWLHGLGLGHPHDTGNGSGTFGTTAMTGVNDDEMDNDRYTVMSYERGGIDVNNQTDSFGYSATPMVLDIAALQWLYGSVANHEGNTTYTLTDAGTVALDIDGDDGSVSIGRAFYAIWDTGGIDTITYSGTKGVVINLNEATLSDTVIPSNIQTLISELNGSTRFNQILPVATAGEMRNDMIDEDFFAGGFFSRIIDTTTGAADRGGYAIANSLYATGGQTTIIENATGGNQADILIGNEQDNVITGNGGDDLLLGAAGHDEVYGGNGADEIYGGVGNDTINGGSSVDTVYGGTGNDVILITGGNFLDEVYGGSGTDILDASAYVTPGFFVNLSTGFYGSTSTSSPQALSSIETVIGTANNDSITGTFATQTFYGGDGDDTFISLFGQFYDNIYGGDGRDTLDHSAETVAGGLFDFDAGTYTGTFAAGDTAVLQSIEEYRDGSGANTIVSAGTGQVLFGNDGDDTMRATSGTETMYGGAGVDTADLSIGDFVYTFNTETGLALEYGGELFLEFEIFQFGSANDSVTTRSSGSISETVYGGAGNDTVTDTSTTGTLGNDLYDGGDGTDTIRYISSTFTSQHVVDLATGFITFSGNNRDTLLNFENVIVENAAGIIGDFGANRLEAIGLFDNIIDGGSGADTLYGGDGNDELTAGAGADSLYGGDGNDLLIVGTSGTNASGETYDGGNGNDTMSFEGAGSGGYQANLALGFADTNGGGFAVTLVSIEHLIGTDVGDNFVGSDASNNLRGEAGNDTLNGGLGEDSLYGGNNDDIAYGGFGNDVLNGGDGIDTLNGDDGNDTLLGLTGDDNLYGGIGNDSLNGGTGNDHIDAGDGNDSVNAGSDNDTIYGGSGADTIIAAAGNDYIDAGVHNDSIDGGNGDDHIIGWGGNDTLLGGTGNDTLNGGAGADNMTGGANNDDYYFDNLGDVIVEAVAGGIDRVNATIGVSLLLLGGELENLTLIGLGNISGDGNNQDNTITGNAGDNVVSGLDGNDNVNGGDGNDLVNGGNGNDTVLGGVGNDTLLGGANNDDLGGGNGNDSLNGGSGDDTLLGNDGNDTLDGSTGNDELTGAAQNDVLLGGGGNDTLNGGNNNDTLTGGNNDDTFVFSGGFGIDQITDFVVASLDVIDLSAVAAIVDYLDLTTNHLSEVAGNSVITAGIHNITILGVTNAQLTASEFLF